jgi:hypothetical protein
MLVATTAKKTFKFPKTMGSCADLIYKLRKRRLDAQKVVDAIEAEEKALKAYIIDNLPKSNLKGATGSVANVRVVTKEIPQVNNWDDFYTFVRKSKRTDLLQKRLSEGAIQEILDSGKKVPGVGLFTAVSLSITKA